MKDHAKGLVGHHFSSNEKHVDEVVKELTAMKHRIND